MDGWMCGEWTQAKGECFILSLFPSSSPHRIVLLPPITFSRYRSRTFSLTLSHDIFRSSFFWPLSYTYTYIYTVYTLYFIHVLFFLTIISCPPAFLVCLFPFTSSPFASVLCYTFHVLPTLPHSPPHLLFIFTQLHFLSYSPSLSSSTSSLPLVINLSLINYW